MNDNNESLRVDINGDEDLRPQGAGRFEVPTYDIDPADKAIADRILAMDPLTDVSGPFSGLEEKLTVEPKLTSLPTEMRSKVERQLAMVPPSKYAESERQFVTAALKEHALSVRTQTGVSGTALPLHKVQAEIAAEARNLANRFNANQELLASVRHHETVTNEKGERVAVPVFTYNGPRREGIVREQEQINYQLKLLEGVEGQRRMQKALLESVAVVKQLEDQQARELEVQAMAEQINRERDIKKRAEIRARFLRSSDD